MGHGSKADLETTLSRRQLGPRIGSDGAGSAGIWHQAGTFWSQALAVSRSVHTVEKQNP